MEDNNKQDLKSRLENLQAYQVCFFNLRAFRLACIHNMPTTDDYKTRILKAFPEAVFMIKEIETRGNFE